MSSKHSIKTNCDRESLIENLTKNLTERDNVNDLQQSSVSFGPDVNKKLTFNSKASSMTTIREHVDETQNTSGNESITLNGLSKSSNSLCGTEIERKQAVDESFENDNILYKNNK